MIKLFNSTDTDYSTLGLGNLTDAIEPVVTEERNGSFELIMKYPIDGIHYSDIKLRNLIVCKSNPFSDYQAFRIYYISKPINGIVTINAEHISYDMSGIVVSPFTATNISGAFAEMKAKSTPACKFNFSTDKSVAANYTVKVPSSLRSLLGGTEGSILDVYGTGEYEFDNFNVNFKTHRGSDRGVTIRYGKNLTDLTQEENCTKVYTAVYPYWFGTKYENDETTEVLVTLDEKTVKVDGTFNFDRVYTLDLSSEFSEPPTKAEIKEKAQKYIERNGIGKPEVSLKISFISLEQAEEYEQLKLLESVYLCDTVTVIFEELGVNSSAKCIKTEYNPLTDKYISLEFGDSRTNLANTIIDQSNSIASAPTASFMDQEIARATKIITTEGLGGYVKLHRSSGQSEPDEILILDENSGGDLTKSVKIWRFNKAGLGFSSKGYNGPYDKIAITMDGKILADEIAANGIKAGTISAAITIISPTIQNAATNPTFSIDKDGNIKGANITGSSFGNSSGTFSVDEDGDINGADITGSKFTNASETFSIDSNGNFSGDGELRLNGSNNAKLNWGKTWGYALSIIADGKDSVGKDAGVNVQNGASSHPQENIVIMHYNKIWRIRYSDTRKDDYAQWGSESSSDIRLKENVEDIPDEIIENFYKKLRPVSYKYINGIDKDTNYGYIAQEILPVINECGLEETQFVNKDENGYYDLTYSNIARLDSMAIHLLFNKIEDLQSQINELRKENK